MDLDAVRADLEQVVREADAVILTLQEVQDDDEESAVVDEQSADQASETSEADREEALVEAAQERRAEAVAALTRLEEGSYGKCIDCGDAIVAARLEFRPEAARCLSCQEKFEDAEG